MTGTRAMAPTTLPRSTQVLVAGGGPVGLAAAVELGRRGIECLVVEPRTSVSHARPRGKTVNVRTAEHLRRWGIVERLRERAPLATSWSNEIVFCTSLTGWELSRFRGVVGLVPEGDRYPELGQQAPQYVLEELAAVLDGWGGPGLLDSYETERRPVQTRVIEAAVTNMQVLAADFVTEDLETSEDARRLADAQIQATKTAEFHALDLVLDIAYDSPVIAAGGARLPHAWLAPGRSLYDELGDGLSLLVLDGDAARAASISDAARERDVPLRIVDLAGRQLRERYGADLVLVRPDQHVAWRGDRPPEDAPALIDRLGGAATSVVSTID